MLTGARSARLPPRPRELGRNTLDTAAGRRRARWPWQGGMRHPTSRCRVSDCPCQRNYEVGLKIEDWPRRIGAPLSARPLGRQTGARDPVQLASAYLWDSAGVIGLLLAYLALEWVSFIHEHKGLPVTPWNPALGLVFAVMLLKGVAYGFVLFVGVVIAEVLILRTQLPWTVILGMAAVIAASFAVAAAVVRRYCRFDRALNHVRDILALLAAGTVAAAMSAILLSAPLLAANELSAGHLAQSSLPLFVGD